MTGRLEATEHAEAIVDLPGGAQPLGLSNGAFRAAIQRGDLLLHDLARAPNLLGIGPQVLDEAGRANGVAALEPAACLGLGRLRRGANRLVHAGADRHDVLVARGVAQQRAHEPVGLFDRARVECLADVLRAALDEEVIEQRSRGVVPRVGVERFLAARDRGAEIAGGIEPPRLLDQTFEVLGAQPRLLALVDGCVEPRAQLRQVRQIGRRAHRTLDEQLRLAEPAVAQVSFRLAQPLAGLARCAGLLDARLKFNGSTIGLPQREDLAAEAIGAVEVAGVQRLAGIGKGGLDLLRDDELLARFPHARVRRLERVDEREGLGERSGPTEPLCLGHRPGGARIEVIDGSTDRDAGRAHVVGVGTELDEDVDRGVGVAGGQPPLRLRLRVGERRGNRPVDLIGQRLCLGHTGRGGEQVADGAIRADEVAAVERGVDALDAGPHLLGAPAFLGSTCGGGLGRPPQLGHARQRGRQFRGLVDQLRRRRDGIAGQVPFGLVEPLGRLPRVEPAAHLVDQLDGPRVVRIEHERLLATGRRGLEVAGLGCLARRRQVRFDLRGPDLRQPPPVGRPPRARELGRSGVRRPAVRLQSQARRLEVARHVDERLVARRRLLLERFRNRADDVRIEPGHDVLHRLGLRAQNLVEDPGLQRAGERLLAGEQLVGHRADGEDVAPMIDVRPRHLLG